MGAQLLVSNADMTRAVHAQTSAASAASAAQLGQLSEIRSEADKIKEHLYNPELSRWLR